MELKIGQSHIWFVLLHKIYDEKLLASYRSILSSEEYSKYRKYYYQRHRKQYLVARVLTRVVLSKYLNIHPKELQFYRNQYGRPEIIDSQNTMDLRFNISHTDGIVMCGVVKGHDIGVDVENINRKSNPLSIANYCFNEQEINHLVRLESDKCCRVFYDYWTLKEAYTKSRGMGLQIPFSDIQFQLCQDNDIKVEFHNGLLDNADQLMFWQFKVEMEYTAAVCIRSVKGYPLQLTPMNIIPLVMTAPLNFSVVRTNK